MQMLGILCLLTWAGASANRKFLRQNHASAGEVQGAQRSVEGLKAEGTTQAALGVMIEDMLMGRGPTVNAVINAAENRMGLKEAEAAIDGELPADVQSLVRSLDDQKSNQLEEKSLQKARKILNGMYEAAWKDLDAKIIECKEFERRNREFYAQVRSDLSRLGNQIATLRKRNVAAGEGIRVENGNWNDAKKKLEDAEKAYKTKKAEDQQDLDLKRADLNVFDFILELSKCGGKLFSFVQLSSNATHVPARVCGTGDGLELQFTDPTVQEKFHRIMTPEARRIIRELLGGQSEFLQLGRSEPTTTAAITTTSAAPTFAIQTVAVEKNPSAVNQWLKCSPEVNCGLLVDMMAMEWGKFRDLVDELKAIMTKDDDEWEKQKANLVEQIKLINNAKTDHMEELAASTAALNDDVQEQGEKKDEKRDLSAVYKKTMKDCKNEIVEIVNTRMCAVKQVRNAVMKTSTDSPPDKIEDCTLSSWSPDACSVPCDDSCPHADPYRCGGYQMLSRRVIAAPNKFGIQCQPMTSKQKCGQFKCPVDCQMSQWTAWSKCTKECESGMRARTRSIMIKPKNGGEECNTVQEEENCNTGSCDRNCRLSGWSEWSPCSMACSGGLQERKRAVTRPIRGQGKCPSEDGRYRLQERECNTQDCVGDEICIAKQDLILLVDSSGSLRKEGSEIIRKFAANITSKYQNKYYGDELMRIGVIQFGNGELMADPTGGPDEIIKPALRTMDLSSDFKAVEEKLKKLEWQKGFTNLAQAFTLAKVMFESSGRKEAQSAVMVLTDGKIAMKYETSKEAQVLKDEANVQIYMAVVSEFQRKDAKFLHGLVSQPYQTNFEFIPGTLTLDQNLDVFTHKLIAKFCPNSFSPSMELLKENTVEFMLIRQRGWPNWKCAKWVYMGRYNELPKCAEAVRKSSVAAFSYGGYRGFNGMCYAEKMTISMDDWNKWQAKDGRLNPVCKGGSWYFNPMFDTYAIKPMPTD